MVDKEQILKTFQQNFRYKSYSQVTVDDQGLISANSDVEATKTWDQLPVKFLEVGGEFRLGNQPTLGSLQGCPQKVGRDFWVRASVLENLMGCPAQVKGTFGVRAPALKSLEYLPQGCHIYWLTWTPHLPMLRLLNYQNVNFGYPVVYGGVAGGEKAVKIIQKYQGTNKPGDILTCASELNEHGFEGNAEW